MLSEFPRRDRHLPNLIEDRIEAEKATNRDTRKDAPQRRTSQRPRAGPTDVPIHSDPDRRPAAFGLVLGKAAARDQTAMVAPLAQVVEMRGDAPVRRLAVSTGYDT